MNVRHDSRKWIRKVDGDLHILPPTEQPKKRWYPGSLEELLWCIKHVHFEEGPSAEARATGSHWAMSHASVTPGHMIETATPVHEKDGNQFEPRLNKVLYDVIPSCLTAEAYRFFRYQPVKVFDPKIPVNTLQNYLFHVEAGMRIHELYSYIDSDGDGKNKLSLAYKIEQEVKAQQPPQQPPVPSYLGPWALETMGGAGGQTIVGVASTSTHGGDVDSGAISDLVIAMHLIAPDGQEYWIERTQIRPNTIPMQLVDQQKIQELYAPGPDKPGGSERSKPIKYLRSDDLVNAALVSCGRMGIIYSVVLRVIRQYALKQDCEKMDWDKVRVWLCNPAHPKFLSFFSNRFAQIDVDVYPEPEFDWENVAWTFALGAVAGPIGLTTGLLLGLKGNNYRAWLITRNMLPLQDAARIDASGQEYFYGRLERAGDKAGKGRLLGKESDSGYFSDPCGTDNVFRPELKRAIDDLSDLREYAIGAWLLLVPIIALGGPLAGPAIKAQRIFERLILFAQYWDFVLSGILSGVSYVLPDEAKFGDVASHVMNALAFIRAHSLVQLLYKLASDGEHPDPAKPLTGISYGVMDQHNYQNRGCVDPGDSIEFFVDANNPLLIQFIDSALAAVRDLASGGKAFGGYISMRFMTTSPSFLAMQRWPRTCSIEIAGLSRASGTEDLIARLEEESRQHDIILHWGQRNKRSMDDIEKHFIPVFNGHLFKWRDALSQLSEHGRLANFSTAFTKVKGLEITQPRIYSLTASIAEGCSTEVTTVTYDALKNPPETKLTLVQIFEDGQRIERALPDLFGSIGIPMGAGRSSLELTALRELNGRTYAALPMQTNIRGFRAGDAWEFQFVATKRQIEGLQRWFAEINLFSQSISNQLRVTEIAISAATGFAWILRNAETGDVRFASISDIHTVPTPVFNKNWQLFTESAAGSGSAPIIRLHFKLTC
jgi:hypothetical protein